MAQAAERERLLYTTREPRALHQAFRTCAEGQSQSLPSTLFATREAAYAVIAKPAWRPREGRMVDLKIPTSIAECRSGDGCEVLAEVLGAECRTYQGEMSCVAILLSSKTSAATEVWDANVQGSVWDVRRT